MLAFIQYLTQRGDGPTEERCAIPCSNWKKGQDRYCFVGISSV